MLMIAVNEVIESWANKHAPMGFGWTSLQINVDTSSEWHYDHRNEGPSVLMVLGRFLSGEFECYGNFPTKLQDQLTLTDGARWHRRSQSRRDAI